MLKRGRISEGWLGELYAGEDTHGRLMRFTSLVDFTDAQRQWVLERNRLMNMTSVHGAIPQLGIHVIQGEPCWVGAWRDAVQLSAVLDSKHIPNTVIMAVAFGLLQSLYSAEQKGIAHGALHPNAIWLGLDGSIWIDGYGCPSLDVQASDDIYSLGCILIEMFLGNNPFPVPETEHNNRIREVGLELQAMGLPNKLPRQILTLLHPNPQKRPTAELLVQKWKLTRAKPIVSSWVRSQFPILQSGQRPEDRIPTTERIAPSPFPSTLYEMEDDLEIPPLLDEDDTILYPQMDLTESEVEIDSTQEVPAFVESTEITEDEPTEETQAIKFLEDFEENFFDSEPTSKLIIDEYLNVEDGELEVESVELREEMPVGSRRLFAGIVWFCAVVLMTFGGMYIIVPAVPAYPEKQSLLQPMAPEESDGKTAAIESGIPPTPFVKVLDEEHQIEKQPEPHPELEQNELPKETVIQSDAPKKPVMVVESDSRPEAPEVKPVVKRASQPKQAAPKPVKKEGESSIPINENASKDRPTSDSEPEPVKTISFDEEVEKSEPSTDIVDRGWDASTVPSIQNADQNQSLVEEKAQGSKDTQEELPAPLPPEPPSGTVSVAGDVKKVRLENKGREVPLGSVPTGEYTVYATFEGFSEFKVTTMSVEEGGKYTIFCVPTFATCKIK